MEKAVTKDKPLYWCDPQKRIDCRKDNCEHLGLGDCLGTLHPEYAQTDKNEQPMIRFRNPDEAVNK
jgi:hypothetical protein